MNPASFLKIKGLWDRFTSNHPKFPMFINAVSQPGVIDEGTVIEVHVKKPTGEDICTNVKLSISDLELFNEIRNMK
jgi:hypothetical protein